MLPWQQRLVGEKAEMDVKLVTFELFRRSQAFAELPSDEQVRLIHRQLCMEEYSRVLDESVRAFTHPEPAKTSSSATPVVMRFIDAPLGCRFRYCVTEPGLTRRIWIKLSAGGGGLIAEYDEKCMQTAGWNGQMRCSFAESFERMRTMEIEVLG